MFSKENWAIAVYYLLLLFVLVSWKSPIVAPPAPLRILFISAMILPATFKYRDWMAPVLICFTTISRYSFAFSFLPYEVGIVAFVLIVCTYFAYGSLLVHKKTPKYLLVLAIYTLYVDIVTGGQILPITYCLWIIICLYRFVNFKTDFAYKFISFSFSVASLVLSILYLTTRNQFSVLYGDWSEGLERSGWTDPNYFGMAIGMGCVAASVMLFSKKNGLLLKLFYLGTIGTTLAVSLLNASRGAILSIAFAMAVLLFFSNIKRHFKISALLIATVFLIYLFNNGYFDLLIYRIQNDSGGGSGRFDIWVLKLLAYFEEGNILNILFGYGGNFGANQLGVSHFMKTTGSHNDFVAFFVNYGPVGLILLLCILFSPIKQFLKNQRHNTALLACSGYLILCCLTLEPLSFGHLPYYAFIFYIIVISRKYENEQ